MTNRNDGKAPSGEGHMEDAIVWHVEPFLPTFEWQNTGYGQEDHAATARG